MSTTVQQPEEKQRFYETEGWFHFIRSNYVTWFTDWLLGLGGKSAQVILVLTTLYMSAELYPGVNLPPQLNLVVFLIQMFSLDMGCLGLGSLARQAERDGNAQGAQKARKFSKLLIAIMIAGLVTVALKQATGSLNIKDTNITGIITAVQTGIELILVIARAFCAVLYGKVVHDLEGEGHQVAPASPDMRKAVQVMQDEMKALTGRFSDMQNRLQSLSMLSVLQAKLAEIESQIESYRAETETEIESRLKGFTAETESGIESRIAEIEGSIESKLKALKAFIEGKNDRPRVTVSEVQSPQPLQRRPIQLPARTKATSQTTPTGDKKEFVFSCLAEDAGMTIAEIQKRGEAIGLKLSTGTISGYRKAFNSGETEIESEDAETESA